ncbi:MAG: ribonuclease III [Deltaproteobacteria bacterium]|nr:ribonuclease III [Deltaproteobacteria bacterium]
MPAITLQNNFKELQEKLSYDFKDQQILAQALTHKSYANEKKGIIKDNERLEFLGDAVLDLSISHLIMEGFPDLSEGDMSKLRASVVNENYLAVMAEEFELNQYLLLGHGEELSGGRNKPSILADSFEAVIAAIYLDGGFDAAFKTVSRHFSRLLSKTDLYTDYKTRLQEFTQERLKCMPVYRLKGASGPYHARIFEVELEIDGKLYGTGKGKTKKEAEQKAAKEALEKLVRRKT